jgi:hypothetical protein
MENQISHLSEATENDKREQRIAWQLLARHDHNASDRDPMTRENCGACVLNGYISRDDRRNGAKNSDGPNYAGWARVYVQAGTRIPRKWHKAFEAELASDNQAYSDALRRDIHIFGVRFGH